jgi:hypothetical protein
MPRSAQHGRSVAPSDTPHVTGESCWQLEKVCEPRRHGQELLRQPGMEVVGCSARSVNYADRSLESGVAQGFLRFTSTTAEEKAGDVCLMERRFVAAGERRTDALALGGTIPIG